MTAVITATAVHVPDDVITNDELVESFNTYVAAENAARAARGEPPLPSSDPDFVLNASGIKARHVLEKSGVLDPQRMVPRIPERPDSSLSVQAEFAARSARTALDRAGVTARDIDLVICSCAHHQRPYPAIGIELQRELGCGGAAFDMNVACSSATFALHLARGMIEGGLADKVLVSSPEIMSGHLNYRDRQTHFIFGDASIAAVVERTRPDDPRTGLYQIRDSRIWTEFSSNIRSNFGFLNRADESGVGKPDKLVTQNGNKVFKEVTHAAEIFIRGLLADNAMTVADLRRMWLHQANARMNTLLARNLLGREPTPDDMPIVLEEYGNTASPGSIIAFDERRDDIAIGETGLICSFGAGYSIGGLLVTRVT